jgi:two-component system response regulator AtoC
VGKYAYPTIVGDSPGILAVKTAIDRVSATNANVVVTGESGTGKELIARAIHSKSQRANKAFVPLNCASLPETLLESELFGIEKGVATGVSKRAGFFEMADGGTLFLDEIGEMSLSMQAKLLRALQEHSFLRVGGTHEIEVDVRVIAATNQEFKQVIQRGDFREDLYYRLNVFPIHVPALRDRKNDIPMLANFILGNVGEKMHLGDKSFTGGSLEAMVAYSWPGNVRELENTIERAVILSDGTEVDMSPIVSGLIEGGQVAQPAAGADESSASGVPGSGEAFFTPDNLEMKRAVAALEMAMIDEAMRQTRGNQLKAAKVLGISREGLRRKMMRYKMNLQEGDSG